MRKQKLLLLQVAIILKYLTRGLGFYPCKFINNSQKYHLLHSSLSSQEAVTYQIQKEDHPISPPIQLTSLKLNETIAPFSSYPELTISRLSFDPSVFLFRNFLSEPKQQLSLMMAALRQGMEYSGTSSGDVVSQRLNSYTSWLYPDDDSGKNCSEESSESEIFFDGKDIARYMTELSAALFCPDNTSFQSSSFSWESEPLQVVRYEVGGKYDMHHDGYNRFLTVLTYLNGVAG